MFRNIFLTAIALLLATELTFAASVSIAPSGDSSYNIEGHSMDGVTGIELNISYDNASLSEPRVAQGSLVYGAMLAANTKNPGNIRIAIISTRAFSGNGQIVSVNFAQRSGIGGITAATTKMIDSKGAPVATSAVNIVNYVAPVAGDGMITAPGVPFSQPAATASDNQSALPSVTKTATGAVTTAGIAAPGTLTMPEDMLPKSEKKPAETENQPPPVYEPPQPVMPESASHDKEPSHPHKTAESKVTTYKSVLESFRDYRGEKSPARLSDLFNKQVAENIQQKPPVALSDGTTAINISVKLDAVSNSTPNVALNGAQLKSLHWDEATSAWIIEALPEAGVVEATLIVLASGEMIEYPLTVAPPAKGLPLTDEGFAAFLKAAPAKRDLNSDGKYDYVDDYIYTANYLAGKSAIKPAAAGKPYAETGINPKRPVSRLLL